MIYFDGDKEVRIENLVFVLVQELNPDRDSTGQIKQFMPQSRYYKSETSKLHSYGHGPFCEFYISSDWAGRRGVYALFCDETLLYIGETVDLQRRFNTGYGNISPINCFQGGQPTNCKINTMVLNQYLSGKKVLLYFYETDDYKRIESSLFRKLSPPYNGSTTYLTVTPQPLRLNHINTNTQNIRKKENDEMTNTEKILKELAKSNKKICDDCLSIEFMIIPRQQVNQICNRENKRGSTRRVNDACDLCKKDKLVNYIS